MSRIHAFFTFSLFSPLLACGDKTSDSGTTDTAIEEVNTEPTEPTSFSLQTTGSENLSLLFDSPTCQIPSAANNFNAFWRNSSGAHVFVFRVMLRGEYTGAGTYDTTNNTLLVTLQEEAGGQGRYYALDSAEGDSASLTLNVEEDGTVWGSISVSTLHSTDGGITLNPSEIPLWCDSDNTAGLEQGQ